MQWVNQVTSIALEMALPPLLGYFADERWKTGPWLVVVGGVLGFSVAMVQLLKLAKQSSRPTSDRPRRGGTSTGGNVEKPGTDADRSGD